MIESDQSLIEFALAGDERRLELLLRRYQAPVFALALARLADWAAAEEVAQDVLVRASQKLGQLKDPGRFPAWVRSIALRQCGMWVRSRRRGSTSVPLQDDAAGRPESAVDDELDIASMIVGLPGALRGAGGMRGGAGGRPSGRRPSRMPNRPVATEVCATGSSPRFSLRPQALFGTRERPDYNCIAWFLVTFDVHLPISVSRVSADR